MIKCTDSESSNSKLSAVCACVCVSSSWRHCYSQLFETRCESIIYGRRPEDETRMQGWANAPHNVCDVRDSICSLPEVAIQQRPHSIRLLCAIVTVTVRVSFCLTGTHISFHSIYACSCAPENIVRCDWERWDVLRWIIQKEPTSKRDLEVLVPYPVATSQNSHNLNSQQPNERPTNICKSARMNHPYNA